MSNSLDLLYTDVEESLRDSIRTVLRKRCPSEDVAAGFDGDRTLGPALWPILATDLGLAGLLVSEDLGGAGASAREAAVVLEELGRFVAPVPFLTSAVVASTVLQEVGATDHLQFLASGSVVAALAVPFSTGPGGLTPTVTVTDGHLSGTIRSVAGAVEADLLIVPVSGGGGLELHCVKTTSASVSDVVSLDMTRPLADIALDAIASEPVAVGERAATALRVALTNGAALLASEQLGVSRWCLETTVEYLSMRRQFSRVVGGYQAIKHRLADLFVDVESASAAARYAAAAVAADDPDREIAASTAQAFCAEVAVRVAEECVQLHGGIGMTWEHPAHLYLKRAKADQIGFGTPGAHYARLAELVGLPAGR